MKRVFQTLTLAIASAAVLNAAPAQQSDQDELELLRKPVTMFHCGDAHQSGSSPRSAAMPRSSR